MSQQSNVEFQNQSTSSPTSSLSFPSSSGTSSESTTSTPSQPLSPAIINIFHQDIQDQDSSADDSLYSIHNNKILTDTTPSLDNITNIPYWKTEGNNSSSEQEDSIESSTFEEGSSSISISSKSSRAPSPEPFKKRLFKLFTPNRNNNTNTNNIIDNNNPHSRSRLRAALERAVATRLEEHRRNIPRRSWFVRKVDYILLKSFVMIMRHHRELCIIFLLFASGLASFRSGPIKTRSTPAPKPFFIERATHKYITDFYRGEYLDLVQRKIPLGPAFVFYYAPWDSESIAARKVFLQVAQYFHHTLPGQIRFYAVNCWWPDGECRKNYKNLSHFPIFVGHLEMTTGIIYSGPIRAELMIKFLNSLLKPLTRIDTEEEMWRFRARHDAIMLGYFNFSDPQSASAYDTYLQMALRNFEADPLGQVGFGLFLIPELAEKFFLTSSNVISLVLFNEIHTAKWTGIKGPVSQVASWVLERTKKTPITWAYQIRTGFANRPVSLGPVDLSTELRKGPVLLLITRRFTSPIYSPLLLSSSFSPFYSAVKEVALDYFNCNKSGNVTKLRKTTHQITSDWIRLRNAMSKMCLQQQNGPVNQTCTLMADQLNQWARKKNFLRRESLANYESVSERLNFTGYSCASERPFRFFAIDPMDIPHFVELGLNGLGFNEDSDPIVLVIDAPNDIIIPLSRFNISSIAEFIHTYTNETQNGRDFSSLSHYWVEHASSISSANTRKIAPPKEISQGYSFIKEIVDPAEKNILEESYEEDRKKEESKQSSYHDLKHQNILVKTITSEQLIQLINDKGEQRNPLFVMFTAKFCGMCGVGLTSFLELSRFLSTYYESGVNVTFAKVDMFKNSMPEELAPQSIPTFVYFPSDNRSNSRVFPTGNQVTTKTLLRFLLSELDPETRVKLSLLSPGCGEGINGECDGKLRGNKKQETNPKCPGGNQYEINSINTNSTLQRENCLTFNKASISDRIQLILEKIQNGFHSQVEGHGFVPWLIKYDGFYEDYGDVDVKAAQYLANLELEHLRSMKLTLEVS